VSGVLWTPWSLRGRYQMYWWDASVVRSRAVSSTNRVTAWRDLVQGVTLTEVYATGSSPQWSPRGLNKRPAIGPFTGSDFLRSATSTVSFASDDLNVFAAARSDSAAGLNRNDRLTAYIADGEVDDYAGAGSLIPVLYKNGSGNLSLYKELDWRAEIANTSGVPFVAWSGFASGATAIRRSGVDGSPETMTGGIGNTGRIVIGDTQYANGLDFWDGVVGEVLYINGTMSFADLERVEGYLAHKWGIPLVRSHPYFNRPPLAVGGSALMLPTRTLVPTSTVSNVGWTPSSGTAHGALAAVGGARVTTSTPGALLRVGLG
jgi:hypothetical protein